jgi:uncharacterized protein (TIGR03437 family)
MPFGFLDQCCTILIEDFNRDGKPDIAFGDIILRGNGDGTFQAPEFFAAGPQPGQLAGSVLAVDLNRDGLSDIVYTTGSGLSVLLNNPPGISTSIFGYSATTGTGPLSPSSIGSVFGKNLTRVTATADLSALPTQLGGISLDIRDSADTVRPAPLFFVSPFQINFLVPDQTAQGLVTLTVNDGSPPASESADATAVVFRAPGFFTADGTGEGLAAATALRVLADGSQQLVAVFDCKSSGSCTANPIDLGGGRPVYLSLYGTGFRYAHEAYLYPSPQSGPPDPLADTTCQVGGKPAAVQFAGRQPTVPGLDQVNILLPDSLPSGPAVVRCQFFGAGSNPVQIGIK